MGRIRTAWITITKAGTGGLMDHDPKKKICIGVNKMCLSVALINATVGMLSFFLTKNLPLLLGVTVEIMSMGIPVLFNYYKKYNLASMTLYIIISSATCYFCCILGKLAEAQLTIVYLVGLAMFMFTDKVYRIFSIAIAIGVVVVIEANFKYEFVPPLQTSETVRYFLRWASYLVVIGLVIFTFDLYRKNNRSLLLKVQQYAEQVELNLKKEAQENKTKDKFISNATHEIRVSFYSIFSIIHILYKVEKKPLKNDLKSCIDDLRAACKSSESIIDNILGYERLNAGLENAVLNQLIDIRMLLLNIVDIYKYLADEKKVRIYVDVSENISRHIVCDEVKLRQIVTNILHNAIKFTRSDTIVCIRVEKRDENFIVSVEDKGEGIHENPDAIFQPFVTKNPDGLGLGLYIVKELVDDLKGRIAVANNSDGGTTFSVTLPLAASIGHTSSVLSLTEIK